MARLPLFQLQLAVGRTRVVCTIGPSAVILISIILWALLTWAGRMPPSAEFPLIQRLLW